MRPQSHPKAEGGLRGGADGRQNERDAGPVGNALRRDSDAARTAACGECFAAFAVAGGRDRAAGGGGVCGIGGARAVALGDAGTQCGVAPGGRVVARTGPALPDAALPYGGPGTGAGTGSAPATG